MAPSVAVAGSLVMLAPRDEHLLTGPERPIVLAPRLPEAPVAESVAPGAPELGVMLPYSPLHHLLLADVDETLVMTSGNVSDEPIAYRDDDALERLGGDRRSVPGPRPADRDAHRRLGRARWSPHGARSPAIRRSRGYVPSAFPLPGAGTPRPLLACGAELKNTFCLARGARARGSATTSATSRTTRRCARSSRASSTSSGCSRSSPRSSPTTSTPSTCRPSTRSSATASS